jgi:hypothetical protein
MNSRKFKIPFHRKPNFHFPSFITMGIRKLKNSWGEYIQDAYISVIWTHSVLKSVVAHNSTQHTLILGYILNMGVEGWWLFKLYKPQLLNQDTIFTWETRKTHGMIKKQHMTAYNKILPVWKNSQNARVFCFWVCRKTSDSTGFG